MHDQSGVPRVGLPEDEATARSVSAACPSSSCSGTKPGEKRGEERASCSK